MIDGMTSNFFRAFFTSTFNENKDRHLFQRGSMEYTAYCQQMIIDICLLHTVGGHDAQGHEGVASHQLIVVIDELTQRLQGPKSQQGDLVLFS